MKTDIPSFFPRATIQEDDVLIYLVDTNSSFRSIEFQSFNNMIRNVYPRWKAIRRKVLTNTILPRVAQKTIEFITGVLHNSNVTLVVDESSSKQGAFLNMVLVSENDQQNSPLRCFFWKSIQLQNALSAKVVAKHVIFAIQELKAKEINVVAYASDNCAVMKASEKLIQKQFPGVVRAPCASHMLNNTLKDIIELEAIGGTWRIVHYSLMFYT